MSEFVIATKPTPRMEAVEENLLGHVSFVQQRLAGMKVDRRGGLVVVEAEDYDAAVELARSCPQLKYGGRIEIREVDGLE